MVLYNWVKAIISILLVIIFIPIAGQFSIEVAEEQGFFARPTGKVLSMIDFFSTVTSHYWFWVAFWFLCGATSMAWFGHLMRWGNKKPVVTPPFESPITNKPNPLNALIQQFKVCDASYIELQRKIETFMIYAIYCIEKMRTDMNVHDTQTLSAISRSPISNAAEFEAEIVYVLNCLDGLGYITMQNANDNSYGFNRCKNGALVGVAHPNMNIRFNEKYLAYY